VDRFTLEENFAAPEYYQMPLEPEELSEQLAKLMELLTFENYSICLTPEAVDLCYEIRKPEVRIRTDRRNKGQPRMGKITELALQDLRLAEMFEREFWSTFRSTESRFKDKTQVIKWCEERVKKYSGPSTAKSRKEGFDVFLCHNSADKEEVKTIGQRLKEKGLSVWLDEWNLTPGRPWVLSLQEVFSQIKAVAVFVGRNGMGPWQSLETYALLQRFAEKKIPIIPVLLDTAAAPDDIPVLLSVFTWVDFRKSDPNPLDRLFWGIKGISPDVA